MTLDKNVRNWLEKNRMWFRSKSGKEETHNVREYGCFLSVRPNKIIEFRKKLAKTLEEGKINFMQEIRSDYFKFMVDVDFKSEFALTNEQKENLMLLIQSAVIEMVGNQVEDNKVIVSSCDDEEIVKNEQRMIKTGFHLIWPNLVVGIDEALCLRSAIVQYLDQVEHNFTTLRDWEDVIDDAIYRNKSSLRMNGSHKKDKCPKCKKKKGIKDECVNCHTTGEIDAGRVYKPIYVINSDNTMDNDFLKRLLNSYIENLKYTSIRTTEEEANINMPNENLPDWFSYNNYTKHTSRRRKRRGYSFQNPIDKIKDENKTYISENDEKYIKLKNYLLSELYKLSPEYDDTLELDKLIKIINRRSISYIFTSRSHYCLNTKNTHGSNHIFFVINKATKDVYQKCTSPWKNAEGQSCEKFKSKSIKLNKEIFQLLFCEQKKILKKSPSMTRKSSKSKKQMELLKLYSFIDD